MLMKFVAGSIMLSLVCSLDSVLSHAAGVSPIQTRIADVLAPEASGESFRVFSTQDGRVYELDSSNPGLVSRVQNLSGSDAPVQLTLDGDRIVEVRELNADEASEYTDILKDDDSFVPAPFASEYQATRFTSPADTSAIFTGLEALSSKSQCYQRAHTWALQMWNQRSIKSMKVFLFFTRKFIREYRYKWWFHVAPFVYAGNEETVLDPEFAETPLEMQAWTNVFVTSEAVCPSVARYSDYENNQEAHDCYTLKLPMYYYQPKDGEALEQGTVITDWRQWDLNHAQGSRRRGWWPF